MNLNTISDNEIKKADWYYSIELRPGVFTKGAKHPNVALTRELLSGLKATGTSCLDIGAQEALISTILAKKGAESVTAVCAQNYPDGEQRINWVKQAHGVSFDYHPCVLLEDLQTAMTQQEKYYFDIVVFSGILYHLINPLGDLIRARSMVRSGGILLIETAAIISDEMALFLNANERFSPGGGNIFMISIPALDYLLRTVWLQPIDCVYHSFRKTRCRIAVTCRAVDAPLPLEGDGWMDKFNFMLPRRLSDFRDWRALKTDRAPLEYHTSNTLKWHRKINAVNLLETVQKTAPLQIRPSMVRLELGAVA